ncbi:NfeD family protein [Sneathiella limimaris]|uniref:NfeD family protein n=1 Tax=Sneathiella limimaris TaxID=1964213 RepID=UPI00146D82A4|nr:NfeD family protein [Sneathiella limimaris]
MFNEIVSWIADLGHWAWWTVAVIFVILEIFAPTFFLLWLGISAGIVGLITLIFPSMTWEYQWTFFAIFSVVSLVVARNFFKKNSGTEDNFKLNQRGAQYVGRQFKLMEAIENGRGKIHVDDSQWTVSGPDLPEGTVVRVTGNDGTLLIVEAIN